MLKLDHEKLRALISGEIDEEMGLLFMDFMFEMNSTPLPVKLVYSCFDGGCYDLEGVSN